MNLALRLLGLNLLSHVGTRLSNPAARTVSSLVLIAANLLPLVGVVRGELGLGDVFVLYWIENVVVWATSSIRILTARGGQATEDGSSITRNHTELAGFFALHFGIFTFVHGVFVITMALLTGGFRGGPWSWALVVGALLVSHVVSLGLNWFGRGERRFVTPGQAMGAPYPRMIVLHVAVIAAFALVLGTGNDNSVLAVALLCGLKVVVDLGLHLRERLRFRSFSPAAA